MPKYRFVWPFYIEDCYECGKALHFQWPLERVYPAVPPEGWKVVVDQVVNAAAYGAVFSKESMVLITPLEVGATITIPRYDVPNFGDAVYKADWGVKGS